MLPQVTGGFSGDVACCIRAPGDGVAWFYPRPPDAVVVAAVDRYHPARVSWTALTAGDGIGSNDFTSRGALASGRGLAVGAWCGDGDIAAFTRCAGLTRKVFLLAPGTEADSQAVHLFVRRNPDHDDDRDTEGVLRGALKWR